MNPELTAAAICATSALAEGILAGRKVTTRFALLKLPRFSPPLWAWAVIGLIYYVVCFVVLRSLLIVPAKGTGWALTFGSMIGMMLLNAGWNYFFFRSGNLRATFNITVAYNVAAVVVFILLLTGYRAVAVIFLAYLVYLIYATLWTHWLVRLNLP